MYVMTRQTLLPFVAASADGHKLLEHKDTYANVTRVTRTVVGSKMDAQYRIPETSLSNEELCRHKRDLTMIPVDNSFSNQPAPSFEAFECKDGILSVPRFYGIHHWGMPTEDAREEGCAMKASEFLGELKQIQTNAVESVIDRLKNDPSGGGLLVLPCGYGKTICALYIAVKMGRRVLVLVHKAFLVEQWQERARTFIPNVTVGKIQQNTVDYEADIVIGMVQSISKRDYPYEVLRTFGTVIIDEAHHMSAPVFHRALTKLPSRYILGLSATPERKDGMTPLLYWSMGSICFRTERQPEHTLVSCILYNDGRRKEITYRDGRVSVPLMLNALVEDTQRNQVLASKIADCYRNGRYIIVLTDRIVQLHTLKAMLVNLCSVDESHIGYYIGTTGFAERNESAGKQIILSTYCMAKEGLDIPRLDTLVQATPKGDVIQASGRVQRKHPDKKVPLIIDVIDTFSIFEQLRWKRWKFYRKEGFCCQVYDSNEEGAWFT